jgi:hypothetical protein
VTTIAWDGTTLAADRCSWANGIRRQVRKVFRVERDGRTFLVAFAGDACYAMAVLAWMRGGARPDPSDHFGREDLNRVCAVAVDEKRRVHCLSNALLWESFRERKFAHGAGHEVAWGALEAGASARRAVQIATKRSDFAALGVDCVRF